MTIATAITVVGIAAVLAAWHIAWRALGKRDDAHDVQLIRTEIERSQAEEIGKLVARVDAYDQRLNTLAAHAAFVRGNPRERHKA